MSVISREPPCDPAPGIALIHGGGWTGGSPHEMDEMAKHLAELGFVAATLEYRFAPLNPWPAQLLDVQVAIRTLRLNAHAIGLNSAQIAAVGVSAGGHLSLWLGASDDSQSEPNPGFSSRVQAVGSISGLHDLRLPMTPEGESYQIVEKLVGTRQGEAVAAASPVTILDRSAAPAYFLHGQSDPLVPANQSEIAEAECQRLGVKTQLQIVPGMGHGLDLSRPREKAAFSQLISWIHSRLQEANR